MTSEETAARQAQWDERYQSSAKVWSGNPNPQLVAESAELAPGRALDVGCGEGADAIWLAERGWEVTAVDISAVALERAAARVSGELAARISWVHEDLLVWKPPAGVFDLVSAQFMQLTADELRPLQSRLAEAVAPGGTLLVVGHHPRDLEQAGVHRPRADVLFTGDDVVARLPSDTWHVVVNEARPRDATNADGNPVVLHDTVVRARRR